jgi:glycosyltransferase involved in cell wall biosynthesis
VALDYITDRDELRKIYSACDVFANCTREDTLSLINIEPQLCGTPSVTYDNTGVRETVDNKCGFSVPTGDSKAFLETLLKVKENGKAKYSDDCVEWAKTKFDRNKNYELYIDLYNSIANKGE